MAQAHKILVVDDHQEIVDSITDLLTSFGFEVISTVISTEGLRLAYTEKSDLIILDWMMPVMSGIMFTQEFRKKDLTTPIIFLTARMTQISHEVEALNIGADDFMTKPYDSGLLIAKIKTQLRRSAISTTKDTAKSSRRVYGGGELVIDDNALQAYVNDKSCELTANEFKLLQYLEKNAGRVCSREELLQKVWEYDFAGGDRTVDVTVRRARKKIEPDQDNYKYILTRRDSGYYFPKDMQS